MTQIAMKMSRIFSQMGSTIYTESRIVIHRVDIDIILARSGIARWTR